MIEPTGILDPLLVVDRFTLAYEAKCAAYDEEWILALRIVVRERLSPRLAFRPGKRSTNNVHRPVVVTMIPVRMMQVSKSSMMQINSLAD